MTSIKKNMQKFYAVSTGRRVGIFTSWNIASQSVTGCAGAIVKAYETMDQAKAAMRLAGFVDPHIFGEEESDPPTISWEEQSEMREEQHEEVNVEEREEEEEANNKKTGEHLEVEIKCWCHEEKKERILKCSDCGHRIHWTCTELPLYQLCIFVNTQRKFTCQFCASKFMDDKTSEEFQTIMPSARVSAVPEETSSASAHTHMYHTPHTLCGQPTATTHQLHCI
eukprot:TRINITY_DN14128_c0_g1_i10.p1 TRINITY_DN14128_c0_g1~~TRINITY_DN14128_c0_g1_i10.p1  ORF type:complete len:224 (-),score=42.62 TRINITY_DN14128_c0_g1_i10:30-701(-)